MNLAAWIGIARLFPCRASLRAGRLSPLSHVFLSAVARRTRRLRIGSLIWAFEQCIISAGCSKRCMLDRRARRVATIRRVFRREVMPTPMLERWQRV
jgi:hypothetical protein